MDVDCELEVSANEKTKEPYECGPSGGRTVLLYVFICIAAISPVFPLEKTETVAYRRRSGGINDHVMIDGKGMLEKLSLCCKEVYLLS